ncbi:MAG: type II toxin-antitoxin system Phd/YefM family antitoxin [Parvularculaceae bacterium]
MSDRAPSKGSEEARAQLPSLIEAAEKGEATIITRRGKPVAALVPIKDYLASETQPSLLPLRGAGKGLWGKSISKTLRELRDEWDR